MVIGGGHFYAVHADHIQAGQLFKKSQHLRTRHASRLRRACAGREGRVQTVNVQRQVARPVTQPFPNGGNVRLQPHPIETAQLPRGINQATLVLNILTCRPLATGTETDLNRVTGLTKPS